MFKLGFSQRTINPKLPVKLGGYYPLRNAETIHDNLWVRTHVLVNQEMRELFIFSSFDLVAIDVKLQQEVLIHLNEKYPNFKIEVFISATHTHSGPVGVLNTSSGIKKSVKDIFGEFNVDYFTQCISQCLETVNEALTSVDHFQYKLLIDEIFDVWKNRHDPEEEGDSSLLAIEFTLASDKKSLIYLYSCHPTILNRQNTSISADLTWGVSGILEEEYDVVQFVNGNSGNISTRYTRATEDFKQIYRFGEKLVKTLMKVKDQPSKSLNLLKVRSKFETMMVKDREDSYLNILHAEYFEDLEYLSFDYSIIQFDDLIFLTIPGEITSDLMEPLKNEFSKLYIMGYTNDYLLYFASKDMYDNNEYEAQSSFLKRGEMEKLLMKVSKQIRGIL